MIRAVFRKSGQSFREVEVSGHAGFGDYGSDIVCASVTSALQLAANGITEVLHAPAKVTADENRVSVTLTEGCGSDAEAFLAALHLHLAVLAEEYAANIKLTVLEV